MNNKKQKKNNKVSALFHQISNNLLLSVVLTLLGTIFICTAGYLMNKSRDHFETLTDSVVQLIDAVERGKVTCSSSVLDTTRYNLNNEIFDRQSTIHRNTKLLILSQSELDEQLSPSSKLVINDLVCLGERLAQSGMNLCENWLPSVGKSDLWRKEIVYNINADEQNNREYYVLAERYLTYLGSIFLSQNLSAEDEKPISCNFDQIKSHIESLTHDSIARRRVVEEQKQTK